MAIKITQIKETCLYVNDLEASERFYGELLGLPLISFVPGRHIFFRAGASVLLCFNAEATKEEKELPPHFGSGELHFAFEVKPEDYEEAKDHIKKGGIAIEHEAEWGKLKSFYFRDPDRHLVEIVMKDIWGM